MWLFLNVNWICKLNWKDVSSLLTRLTSPQRSLLIITCTLHNGREPVVGMTRNDARERLPRSGELNSLTFFCKNRKKFSNIPIFSWHLKPQVTIGCQVYI